MIYLPPGIDISGNVSMRTMVKTNVASRIQALPSSPLKIVMERSYESISRFFLSIPFSERKKKYGCSAVPTGNIEES